MASFAPVAQVQIHHKNKNRNKNFRLNLNNLFQDPKADVECGTHCSVFKSNALPWKVVFGLREDSPLSCLFICVPSFVHSRHSVSTC